MGYHGTKLRMTNVVMNQVEALVIQYNTLKYY